MSKGDIIACKFLAVYAAVVATNEWLHYGVTWVFGPDGWPMSLPGDPPGSAIGHNKQFLQLSITVLILMSAFAWYRSRRDKRRKAAYADFEAALEATKSMPDHLAFPALERAVREYEKRY